MKYAKQGHGGLAQEISSHHIKMREKLASLNLQNYLFLILVKIHM